MREAAFDLFVSLPLFSFRERFFAAWSTPVWAVRDVLLPSSYVPGSSRTLHPRRTGQRAFLRALCTTQRLSRTVSIENPKYQLSEVSTYLSWA